MKAVRTMMKCSVFTYTNILQAWISSVVAKGVSEMGNGPRPCACRAFICLTPVLVCIAIAFSPYTVAEVYLIHKYFYQRPTTVRRNRES
jgi:hypothetical protein